MEKKYIFVFGGVISGIGKGVFTASLVRLLKERGINVGVIKIDPYVNVDAGTMRPTEHGEVYVTFDGGEVDQDLGTYERFLSERISKNNNITTGKVFLRVIDKERRGQYLGKTVQVIPHIVEEVINMIEEASAGKEVVIVEVGGVVGDIENKFYIHASKMLEFSGKDVLNILVAYAPIPKHLGEVKTKPIQHAAKHLRVEGILPDVLIIRSETELEKDRIKKISRRVYVREDEIISLPDVDNTYIIPLASSPLP